MPAKPDLSNDDFVQMVDTFSQYLNYALSCTEEDLQNGNRHRVISNMPSLISIGNTMGYFRGEDSPLKHEQGVLPPSEFRRIAATSESDFEKRVFSIITAIMESNMSDEHILNLFRYFTVARSVGYAKESTLNRPI